GSKPGMIPIFYMKEEGPVVGQCLRAPQAPPPPPPGHTPPAARSAPPPPRPRLRGGSRLTIPISFSPITMPASLRSDCCSPSLRNAVRLPSGIDVRLHRNTHLCSRRLVSSFNGTMTEIWSVQQKTSCRISRFRSFQLSYYRDSRSEIPEIQD